MKKGGFTLVEMMVVIAIITILLGFGLPNLLRIGTRSKVSQATADTALLKTAIDSYWTHHTYAYPADIAASLTGAVPCILEKVLKEPFTKGNYNYVRTDSNNVYAVWSNGPNKAQNWAWSGSAGANRTLSLNGSDDIVATNVRILP